MIRLYDTIEPNVIDEELLKLAVEEQGPQEAAGQVAKQEGINFKDVRSLQLDFQNILRIDNLWQFVSLTKLQLDNNIIEKIDGLESLVNLVWLDLSFNNIESIEGLDTLVNLEDLSLFSNRIAKMDAMDSLVKLQVFSIGNNMLDNLLNVSVHDSCQCFISRMTFLLKKRYLNLSKQVLNCWWSCEMIQPFWRAI
uniref:Dynein regulatory complex subunit 3 n=1 Tax=Vombatus ursinus TaxID=29139 RepID=A0A4X2KV01_VOMUR